MTSHIRQLRIENHPDRWGGDHSRMEIVFAAMKQKRQAKDSINHCRQCGVPTRGVNCLTHSRRKVLVAIVLLASAICSFAQRGTGANPVAVEPVVSIFSLPSAAVAPFKQTYLTWDNPAGASNRVSWGTARNYWTNGSVMIFTNRFPITNGAAYKVTALVGDVESVPALWPSNRVAELWLRGNGTNMTQGTNIVRLVKFTNSPPGNMQFWGVANITTGWE